MRALVLPLTKRVETRSSGGDGLVTSKCYFDKRLRIVTSAMQSSHNVSFVNVQSHRLLVVQRIQRSLFSTLLTACVNIELA